MKLTELLNNSISGYRELMVLLEEVSKTASIKTPDELLKSIQEITEKQDKERLTHLQIMESLQEHIPADHKALIDKWYQTLKVVIEKNDSCIPLLKTQQSLLGDELKKIKHGMHTLSAYNSNQL
jgi:sugar-specific transcriptional regulator TrmB